MTKYDDVNTPQKIYALNMIFDTPNDQVRGFGGNAPEAKFKISFITEAKARASGASRKARALAVPSSLRLALGAPFKTLSVMIFIG